MGYTDSQARGEETKVRPQHWQRQTSVSSHQEKLEVAMTTLIQNQYELLLQQVWASLDDGNR